MSSTGNLQLDIKILEGVKETLQSSNCIAIGKHENMESTALKVKTDESNNTKIGGIITEVMGNALKEITSKIDEEINALKAQIK